MHPPYVLGVYKDTGVYLFVLRKSNQRFDTILIDNYFTTNNSGVEFRDVNKDGFADIVWSKKWEDHAYLFNPAIENFVDVGEFHDIDTLRQKDGSLVLYNNQYPVLYLISPERDDGWVTELHSELFVIKSDYIKISFATINNFSTFRDMEKYYPKRNVLITCYTPPYNETYGDNWSEGIKADSMEMKAGKFNKSLITKYWATHYKMLLQHGKPSADYREQSLKIFK